MIVDIVVVVRRRPQGHGWHNAVAAAGGSKCFVTFAKHNGDAGRLLRVFRHAFHLLPSGRISKTHIITRCLTICHDEILRALPPSAMAKALQRELEKLCSQPIKHKPDRHAWRWPWINPRNARNSNYYNWKLTELLWDSAF